MKLIEFESSSRNPFMIDHKFIRPFVTHSLSKDTGEFNSKAKLGDFEEHVRVFPSAYGDFGKLNSMSIQIIGYIFKELSEDMDYVVLSPKVLSSEFGASANNTILRGIKDLLKNGFLAKKTGTHEYWINPSKIFKGSRAKWFNSIHEKD